MKKTRKIIAVILISVLLLAMIAAVGYALYGYSSGGNQLLLKTYDSFAPVTEKLDSLRIPYGTEYLSPDEAAIYDTDADESAEYMLIETRTELVSVLEEACAVDGVEVIPIYRDAHTLLFVVLIVSALIISVFCIIAGICAGTSAKRAIFFTAAFLSDAVCMTVLIALELTPML